MYPHVTFVMISPVRTLQIAALHTFFPEPQKYTFTQPIQGRKSENANPLRNMLFFQNRQAVKVKGVNKTDSQAQAGIVW